MEKMRVAVPITDKVESDILNKGLEINSSKADMVEWRVDFYENVKDLDKVLETLKNLRNLVNNKELLFTFRSKNQGGKLEITQDYYLKLNRQVSKSNNVDYIDIEIDYLDRINSLDVPIIGSYHNFKETPSKNKILSILKEMESKNADLLKIALMPNNPKDVLTLLDATYDMYTSTDKPIISISMGELGKMSRIFGGLFGSSLTFASLGEESAPGQMTLEQVINAIKTL